MVVVLLALSHCYKNGISSRCNKIIQCVDYGTARLSVEYIPEPSITHLQIYKKLYGSFVTRNDFDSEKVDLHVDISKSPRGDLEISTWGRNETSEESNDMSEESFRAHVENKK